MDVPGRLVRVLDVVVVRGAGEARVVQVAAVVVGERVGRRVEVSVEVSARVVEDRAQEPPAAARQADARTGRPVVPGDAVADHQPAGHEGVGVVVVLDQAVVEPERAVFGDRRAAPGHRDHAELRVGHAERRAVFARLRVGGREDEAVEHRALRAEDEHRRVVGPGGRAADFAGEDGPVVDPVPLGAPRLAAGEAAVDLGAGGQREARLAVGSGRGLVGPLGDPNFGTGRDRGEGRGERRPGVRPGRTVARAGGVRVELLFSVGLGGGVG